MPKQLPAAVGKHQPLLPIGQERRCRRVLLEWSCRRPELPKFICICKRVVFVNELYLKIL